MSFLTYYAGMAASDRPLIWLHGTVKTPPFSAAARLEAGVLLRRLQRGDKLSLPQARPMPVIGPRCGELRIPDADATWRIMYRLDPDAVIILPVFAKKTQATPKAILETCAARLKLYDRHARGGT
jgi:phage-related protein